MRTILRARPRTTTLLLTVGLALNLWTPRAFAQVSPQEVLNPDLKALEQTYFPQLKILSQQISRTNFRFPFYLSRYVGLDPAQQAEADSRGIEFVRFQDRSILKVTGNYNAAYDTLRMSQNERAGATFRAVILPILNLVTAALPEDLSYDGVGFEISHHARTKEPSYEFEGKEILVVVLDRGDAWAMSRAATDVERQEILNRSKVFVSGKDYGLSLTERDPLNVLTLSRSIPVKPDATSTARSSTLASRSSLMKSFVATPTAPSTPIAAEPARATTIAAPPAAATADPPPATLPTVVAIAPTQADADRLSERYQSQLDALAKLGTAKFHFVAYAPPTFVVYHEKMALQITLKNSLQFGAAKGSIYKRAAQSFDLFLAGVLKDILDRVSADVEFQLYDFSVLNELAPGLKGTSEAVEFICPRDALNNFVTADITNQQLLDQCIVLVNGERIALNLQLVE